jgi:hypothetical protein
MPKLPIIAIAMFEAFANLRSKLAIASIVFKRCSTCSLLDLFSSNLRRRKPVLDFGCFPDCATWHCEALS